MSDFAERKALEDAFKVDGDEDDDDYEEEVLNLEDDDGKLSSFLISIMINEVFIS